MNSQMVHDQQCENGGEELTKYGKVYCCAVM